MTAQTRRDRTGRAPTGREETEARISAALAVLDDPIRYSDDTPLVSAPRIRHALEGWAHEPPASPETQAY